jgi:Glycosyltransferase
MAERLRVALVAGTLGRGGAEKQILLMARALRAAGTDVRVYSLTRGETYESKLLASGVGVHSVGGGSFPPLRLVALTAALGRFRPHVVQACHTFVNLYAAVAAKPIGAISIGALRDTPANARRGNGAWTALHFSLPQALIVNSSCAAEELARGRRKARPLFVLPNVIEVPGPPPERAATDRGPVHAAFVGRLIPLKRLDVFLRALAIARREVPRLRAVIAGDGAERPRMEALARDLGLVAPALTFLGTVEAVDDLLRSVDLLVLSSDEEGFPNVVLEAMAAGLPVVATRAGDAARAVQEGRTGFVVPVGDVPALAARMAELARSPELRRRLGGAGFERARDVYGTGPLASRLFAIYRELAERTNHQRTVVALGGRGRSVHRQFPGGDSAPGPTVGRLLAAGAGSVMEAATALVSAARPRLCIVGPLVGRNPGYVTTPGETLAEMLRNAGYSVLTVSHSTNRYVRFADVVYTLLGNLRRIDVLVLSVYGGPSFIIEDAASLLAKRFGVPIVMHLHGGAMPQFMARFPRWTRRVLGRAHILVTPSEYLARLLRKYGFDAEAIPNMINLEAYPYRHRVAVRPRLLWMRAFHSIYHPEMAVRVLARVRERLPEATLVMAGQDKGLKPAVKRLAAELGLAGAIRFAGFLDTEGKSREFAAADVFINTNRIDNQPVSVIEVLASGLPVVATAVGGVPDLLKHGETGLLVPDGDVEAMAEAVVRLTEDGSLAGRLSSGGRGLAARFDAGAVFARWEVLFGRVLSGSGCASEVAG